MRHGLFVKYQTCYNVSMDSALPENVRAVVLFDGACGLCQRSVRFAARRDRNDVLRFASQYTPTGQAWLKQVGLSELPNSVVVYEIQKEKLSLRSRAALRLATYLGFPWCLAGGMLIIPSCLLDPFYQLIAKVRRRLFKPNACMLDDAVRDRLLDFGESATAGDEE